MSNNNNNNNNKPNNNKPNNNNNNKPNNNKPNSNKPNNNKPKERYAQEEWGLQKVWNYNLSQAQEYMLSHELSHYVLIMGLIPQSEQFGKNNAETITCNNSYVTNTKYGPKFSAKRFVLIVPSEQEQKVQLIKPRTAKDIFGIDVPEYQNLDFSFSIRLNQKIYQQLGIETWNDFKELVWSNPKNQLQILVSREINVVPELPKPEPKFKVVVKNISPSQVVNVKFIKHTEPAYVKAVEQGDFVVRQMTGEVLSQNYKPKIVGYNLNPSWRSSVTPSSSSAASDLGTVYNSVPNSDPQTNSDTQTNSVSETEVLWDL